MRHSVGGIILLVFASVLLGAACSERQVPAPDRVVLFSRPWWRPIWMEDTPSPGEVGVPVRLAAARGEAEPASVGVFSPRALAGARLDLAGDLAGPDGAVFPADAVEIRVTRYIEPLRRWPRLAGHPLHPGWLDPAGPVDVPAGRCRQFWVTVHVPPRARAGTYRGELVLTGEGRRLAALPLEVTVRPFALDPVPAATFLHGDDWPRGDEGFADSRDHGMTTICVSPGWMKQEVPRIDGDRVEFPRDFAEVRETVRRARAAGLAVDRPVCVMTYQHFVTSVPAGLRRAGLVSPLGELKRIDFNAGYRVFFEDREAVTGVPHQKGEYWPAPDPRAYPETRYGRRAYGAWVAALRRLDEISREEGWPGAFYWLIDEPHHSRGAMRLAIVMLRAAEEARVDAMITCNEPTVSEPDPEKWWFPPVGDEPALLLEPELDTRCYVNRYLGPETAERTRRAGDVYATYVNIYGNRPLPTRVLSGFLPWRLGIERLMFWTRKYASTTNPDGTRSFLRDWEAAREGIDDWRYAATLERLLREGAGDAAAREAAREVLAEVREAVVVDPRAIGYVDGETGEWVPGGMAGPRRLPAPLRRFLGRRKFGAGWPEGRADELRARLADAIERLVAREPGEGG